MILILALIAAFLLAFTVVIQVTGHYLIHRRRPDHVDPPSNYGLAFESVTFPSRDETPLAGWWIPAAVSPAEGTIIVCHGQFGSKDGDTRQVVPLHEAGFNVLMFDFRAHGHSGGRYLTMGMYEKEDVLGAVDYLEREHGIERAAILGFSMGAAAAMIAATLTDRIITIVADGCFVHFKSTMARWLRARGVRPYQLGWEIAAWALAAAGLRTEGRMDQVDVSLWARHVTCPVLFIHGENDPLITVREVELLASQCTSEVWIVPDSGHRDAFLKYNVVYNDRIIAWFKHHCIKEYSDGRERALGRSPE